MIRFGLIIASAVAALDQATKLLILHVVMDPPRIIDVTPFFNIVLVFNRGVSFGLFNADSAWTPWLLSAVALVITVVLVVWLRHVEVRLMASALGLVIGGALGNVIDRVFYAEHAVTDFLDFHVGECQYCHWPAFNVADSAITIGVALLLIDSLIAPRRRPKFAPGSDAQENDG